MNHFPEHLDVVLRAVVSAPLAWQTPAQLAGRLGVELESLNDALADLEADGWLDPWEMGEALFVTLSPVAAEWLGVRLDPVGRSDAMRWASIDDPEPSGPLASRGVGGGTLLDLIPDPAPGPEAMLEASERALRIAASRAAAGDDSWFDSLPRPSTLLGSGLTPWPGPSRRAGRPCPACLSGPISESAYCLVCDRWGLDHMLAALGRGRPAGSSPRTTPNPARDPSAERAGAKLARKAKRRRRRSAQADRERAGSASAGKARPRSGEGSKPGARPSPA